MGLVGELKLTIDFDVKDYQTACLHYIIKTDVKERSRI